MKNIMQRTCMGCNCKKDKKEFLRIVKNTISQKAELDLSYEKQARGAYICNDETCFNKVVKNKRIERNFKFKIEPENYEEMRGRVFGEK